MDRNILTVNWPFLNCTQFIKCSLQIGRLRECERMLVALELAGWLNESSMALQAVVQCYGVLAPLIHFKIPAIPVIQVCKS